jgi:hypothetical protein
VHGLPQRHRRRQAVLGRGGLVGEGFTGPAGLAGFTSRAHCRPDGDAVNPGRPFPIGDRETAFLAHGFEFLHARRGGMHSHGSPPVKQDVDVGDVNFQNMDSDTVADDIDLL